MLWPDEIRSARFEFLDNEVEVRRQELAMAESLIESMTGDFDPSEYTDEYRDALQLLIDAKLAGGKGIEAPAVVAGEDSGQVVDLMAALRESVARSQAKRGGEQEEAAPVAAKKPTRKKAATKAVAAEAEEGPPLVAKTAKKAAKKSTKSTTVKATKKTA